MIKPVHKKSTFEVWQNWATLLQGQLVRIHNVYTDQGMQAKAVKLEDYKKRLELFIDPVAHARELATQSFDVQGSVHKIQLLALTNLIGLFKEAMAMMPELSKDMQHILKSPCRGACNGRVAADIFKGPYGSVNTGIGNGIPDIEGSIVWELQDLLDKYEVGGDAYLAAGLDKQKSGHTDSDGESGPNRHTASKTTKMVTSGGIG